MLWVECQSQSFVYFVRMHTCKPNTQDAHDPKTINKYFNDPYLGYFSSDLYQICNIVHQFIEIFDNMYTNSNTNAQYLNE